MVIEQDRSDTICALSSGSGRCAIAVIRLSGPHVRGVCGAMAGGVPRARVASLRRLRHPVTGDLLDEILLLFMPGPASYTGEDCAEIQCHGSMAVVRDILAALTGISGVRLAEAGEFTVRAFRNTKCDTLEVEGLADLLNSTTSAQRRLALRAVEGETSAAVAQWRKILVQMAAQVEAAIDFSDEADVVAASLQGVAEQLAGLVRDVKEALSRSYRMERLRDGVRVVIAGPPNAGKSMLFNRLLAREAALVSPFAGTTRDVLDAALEINGIPVLLTDTAGIRDADDPVEKMGVARAETVRQQADVVLWVTAFDATERPPEPGSALLIQVRNKCEVGTQGAALVVGQISLSAQTGQGLDLLLAALGDALGTWADDSGMAVFVRQRQLDVLSSLAERLAACGVACALSPEILAEELRAAIVQIGRLTGRIDIEDVLDALFREFCIGK